MKQMIKRSIEDKALKLLADLGFHRSPVPVEKVARSLGLALWPADLGDDISGVLVVDGDSGTIGYDPSQAPVRQRFTIAHEIGHFMLHTSENNLFIDKGYTVVFKRDQRSATGEHLREIEANQFAACLLMPRDLIEREMRHLLFDLGNENGLKQLADRFQVSSQAMSIRLGSLGFFEH